MTGVSALLPGLLLTACSSADRAPEAVVRRDSAGVELIEYSTTALEAVPMYAISDTFDLSIGLAEGAASYVFGRVGAVAELSDGSIAIFDDMANELRFFSADGAYLTAVGRGGEGPREFGGVDGWWHCGGDTLLAWDGRLSRLAFISEHGAVFDVVPVRPGGEQVDYFMGMYPDHSMLFLDQSYERASDGTRIQYTSMLRISHAAGEGLDGLEVSRDPARGREGRGSWSADTILREGRSVPPETASQPLFRAQTGGGIHPEGVLVVATTEPEIRLYDQAGALRRIVRWDAGDRRFTESHWEAYLASVLEGVAPDRQVRLRASLEARSRPEFLPAIAFGGSDMSGRAWVMRFEPPGENLVGELLVFSPDGGLEARIEGWQPMEPLPRSLDAVWQRGTDREGAPHATRHRLVRVGGNL